MSIFERSHHLISVENDKLVVQKDTLSKIKNIKAGKNGIASIAVAGPYHKGKSYIMNLLSQTKDMLNDGFEVGTSLKGQTIGIWVIAKKITIQGREQVVLFMDSEGINNPLMEDDRATHDSRIFTLCLLLGTVFLYNTHGLLSEASLQHLSFITSLTEHVGEGGDTSMDDKGDNKTNSMSLDFPRLIWLVRDFQDWDDLEMRYKGNSKAYLEDVLRETQNEAHDNIRKGLSKIFPEEQRQCTVLPQPALRTAKLKETPVEKVDQEFIGMVKNLREDIMEKIKPKRQGGKVLSAREYCTLINFCVSAMNKRIDNVNLFVPDVHAQMVLKQAIDVYAAAMEKVTKQFPLEAEPLKAAHEKAKKEAMEYFDVNAYGPTKESLSEKLDQKLDSKFAQFKDRNIEALSQAYMGFGNLQNMMIAAFVFLIFMLLLPRLLSLGLIVAVGSVVVFGGVPLHKLTHTLTTIITAISKGQGKMYAGAGVGLVAAYLLYGVLF